MNIIILHNLISCIKLQIMKSIERVVLLWVLTIIGMILHFNYHIGGIFYGMDITVEGSNGLITNSTHVIRGLFYHLPIIYILLIMYLKGKIFNWIMLGVSIVYIIAHVSHLFGEMKSDHADISQISLLTLVLIIGLLINKEHFNKAR